MLARESHVGFHAGSTVLIKVDTPPTLKLDLKVFVQIPFPSPTGARR